MADEEELLRQAKVLAAVDQEEHDGEGEPNRHGRDGRAHLQDLGGLYNYSIFCMGCTGCPIWSETWVGLNLNLVVPMSVRFCLGRWKFGRIGWAASRVPCSKARE